MVGGLRLFCSSTRQQSRQLWVIVDLLTYAGHPRPAPEAAILSGKRAAFSIPQVNDVTGAEHLDPGGRADDKPAGRVDCFRDPLDAALIAEDHANPAPDRLAAFGVARGDTAFGNTAAGCRLPAPVDQLE